MTVLCLVFGYASACYLVERLSTKKTLNFHVDSLKAGLYIFAHRDLVLRMHFVTLFYTPLHTTTTKHSTHTTTTSNTSTCFKFIKWSVSFYLMHDGTQPINARYLRSLKRISVDNIGDELIYCFRVPIHLISAVIN